MALSCFAPCCKQPPLPGGSPRRPVSRASSQPVKGRALKELRRDLNAYLDITKYISNGNERNSCLSVLTHCLPCRSDHGSFVHNSPLQSLLMKLASKNIIPLHFIKLPIRSTSKPELITEGLEARSGVTVHFDTIDKYSLEDDPDNPKISTNPSKTAPPKTLPSIRDIAFALVTKCPRKTFYVPLLSGNNRVLPYYLKIEGQENNDSGAVLGAQKAKMSLWNPKTGKEKQIHTVKAQSTLTDTRAKDYLDNCLVLDYVANNPLLDYDDAVPTSQLTPKPTNFTRTLRGRVPGSDWPSSPGSDGSSPSRPNGRPSLHRKSSRV